MRTFFLFFLLPFNIVVSQTQVKGRLVDKETNTPLSRSSIYNLETNKVILTDEFGQFILPSIGKYHFKKEGYKGKIIQVISDNLLIIQLSLKPTELNEVVVHSNQIPKILKKSVATIEVLSKKDIKIDLNLLKIRFTASISFTGSPVLIVEMLPIIDNASDTINILIAQIANIARSNPIPFPVHTTISGISKIRNLQTYL